MASQDQELMEFGRIYLAYRDKFTAIARSYVRDQAVAEDIVSECFTLFWGRRESLTINVSPESYILRSIKNRCLNYLRDNARMILSEGMPDQDGNVRLKAILPEINALSSEDMADIFSSEVRQIFSGFMKSLPDRTRKVFYSSRFESLTYDEIAARYGITTRMVKRDIQKALELLRHALKDYLPALAILLCSGSQ